MMLIFLKVPYLCLSCVYHTARGSTPQARTHFPRLFPDHPNSLTFPGFPGRWPPWVLYFVTCCVVVLKYGIMRNHSSNITLNIKIFTI